MLDDLWREMVQWWNALTPEFAFLLALPFAVAAAGLLAEARCVLRARRAPPPVQHHSSRKPAL